MRDEIKQQRAEKIAQLARAGTTIADAMRATGCARETINKYAEEFGFSFQSRTDFRLEELIRMAAEGMTRNEAATALGITQTAISRYCKKYRIKLQRARTGNKQRANLQRAEIMASMYASGKTLAEIGVVYGLTRERVRQIVTKYSDLTRYEGGKSAKATAKRMAAAAKKDANSLRKYGCTYAQYMDLVSMGCGDVRKSGSRAPTMAFKSQRSAAVHRGIEWNIKLWDWWQVWCKSGKWDERGRKRGEYVMCRFGDIGAYELGNVYIATTNHNHSFQPNNPNRKSHPDFEKRLAERRRARVDEHSPVAA